MTYRIELAYRKGFMASPETWPTRKEAEEALPQLQAKWPTDWLKVVEDKHADEKHP